MPEEDYVVDIIDADIIPASFFDDAEVIDADIVAESLDAEPVPPIASAASGAGTSSIFHLFNGVAEDKRHQLVPPVLDYDELYLFPTERYQHALDAHDRACQEYQTYLATKTERERQKLRESGAATLESQAKARREEAERQAVVADDKRRQEAHARRLVETEAANRQLEDQNNTLTDQNAALKLDAERARKAKNGYIDSVLSIFLTVSCSLGRPLTTVGTETSAKEA